MEIVKNSVKLGISQFCLANYKGYSKNLLEEGSPFV